MPDEIYILISVVFIGFGIGVIARPQAVSATLKRFYGNYPIVRLLNEKQHTSRKPFVVALGLTFIVVGVIALITMRP